MEKKEIVIGCLGHLIALGVPGYIFVEAVMPVVIGVAQDARTTGVALLMPNQPGEAVEAAIADVLEPAGTYAPPAYVPGTCEELLEKGLRNFFRGEPNYTPERDPDNNGLACEDR